MSGEGMLPNEFRTHGADSAIDDELIDAQPVDTVAFVQEWMMSGDYEPDQWHRDFAAAIDGRIPTMAPGDEIRIVREHFTPPALRKSARAVDLGGRS